VLGIHTALEITFWKRYAISVEKFDILLETQLILYLIGSRRGSRPSFGIHSVEYSLICWLAVFAGYIVELQGKSPESLLQIHTMITHFFPGAVVEEEHNTRVKYSIPVEGLSLSKVFRTIEAEKERVGLEDYSVSQSSLEQIFISFAKGRDHSIDDS
jgi:hypothetical protein